MEANGASLFETMNKVGEDTREGKRIAIMLHYSWMSTQIYRLLLSLIIIEMADPSISLLPDPPTRL